jgi:type I restriction enzyme S subunit
VFGYASISLGELFETRNGYTPSKNNDNFWNGGIIPWFRMEDIRENGRVLDDAIQHITPEAVKGDLFPEYSIIVSTTATIGEHALVTVPFLSNQRFTCLMLKDKYKELVNIKFLFYYCFILGEFCKGHINQGNFASVDMKSFNDFIFNIPDLTTQKNTVSILDRFNDLCNDISSGLPAEIEARQKQYEYYRDKLLTFKEKN